MSELVESFEWDPVKQDANIAKHGVGFHDAQLAFLDPKRNAAEARYFCIGRVRDGILTVRFTWREKRIRIIGAGFWREGRKLYEDQNR